MKAKIEGPAYTREGKDWPCAEITIDRHTRCCRVYAATEAEANERARIIVDALNGAARAAVTIPDLTKIEQPFGTLPKATQDALKAHGGPYQLRHREGHWLTSTWGPQWQDQLTYRVAPTTAPVEPQSGPVPHDPVNHPRHYTDHPSGVECIQITEHMGFNLGNAVKYIWRADLKGDRKQDLLKAQFYVNREIARLDAKDAGAEVVE